MAPLAVARHIDPSVSVAIPLHEFFPSKHQDLWLTAPRCGSHSPSVNSDKISESKEVKKWVDNYLGMGEWIMDQSVAVLGSSGWFKRER